MALYTIGDTHLSLAKDKPMDIFGEKWKNHAQKLKDGFSIVGEDDLTVICGDISWGMGIEETKEDFLFIDALPGSQYGIGDRILSIIGISQTIQSIAIQTVL